SPACAETSGGRMARIWLGRLLGAVLACCAASAEAQERNDARQEARALYERIIAFDTSTGPQNVAMAQFLAERFVAGGFAEEDVHIIPANDTVGLLVRYRGDGSVARPILLIAHMEVVPALRSRCDREPFTLVEENGFFFGRGASDNKAGVAHLVETMLTLRAEGFTPSRDVLLWLSGDEETTGATTMALVADHRALIGEPEYALNADAGGGQLMQDGAVIYALQTAEKTYASFTFTARNEGGHSSVPRADNAIYA